MNTSELKQIAKNSYEAFQRGDIETVLNSCSDNVEWILPGYPDIPYAGTY